MSAVLVRLVRLYQLLVSPLLGPRCRFYPSCSAYAVTALQRHGALYGSWLAARRLLRCHPWNPGGVDLVPEAPRHSFARSAAPRPGSGVAVSRCEAMPVPRSRALSLLRRRRSTTPTAQGA